MDNKQKALNDIKLVKETIELNKYGKFRSDFINSTTSLFWLSSILILLAAILSNHIYDNFGPTGVVALWSSIIIIIGLWKALLFLKIGGKYGFTLTQFLKRVVPNEFWKIEIPLELTAIGVLVYLIGASMFSYIIPLTLFVAGHILITFATFLKKRTYSICGWIHILWAFLGLTLLKTDPLIVVAGGYGLTYLIGGVLETFRKRGVREQ